jgi:hypothetical protein
MHRHILSEISLNCGVSSGVLLDPSTVDLGMIGAENGTGSGGACIALALECERGYRPGPRHLYRSHRSLEIPPRNNLYSFSASKGHKHQS